MKRIIIMAALIALAGCSLPGEQLDSKRIDNGLSVFHDAENKVTCWMMIYGYAGGLSCWPDHLLEREQ